jgi:hypothetical protein
MADKDRATGQYGPGRSVRNNLIEAAAPGPILRVSPHPFQVENFIIKTVS